MPENEVVHEIVYISVVYWFDRRDNPDRQFTDIDNILLWQ